MSTGPYAGYILSAYGLAAVIVAGLVLRAIRARSAQLKALRALDPDQKD
jgi:heme exporter protein CcmD